MIIPQNLLRRRTRTALTLLGITIGIATIVALSALSEGLLDNFSDVMASSQADLSVQAKQEPGTAIQVAMNTIDARYADELRALPEVRAVSGMLFTIVPMPGVPYFVLFGHEPDQFAIQRFKITAGQSLSARAERLQGRPLLLGKLAADNLKKKVGGTIAIYGVSYRVVGIYETGSVMEDGGAVVSLEEAQRLANQPQQVSNLWVKLERPERLENVRQRLQRRYPDLQIVRAESSSGLTWLELIRPFAWGIALIASLVGGVGMMNATLMSIFERTREIGVLRALGWKRGQVLRLILGESLLLSLLGGVTGTALGVLLVKLVGSLPSMSGLTRGTLTPTLFAQAFVAALVFGTVGGLYPAWWASRLAPIEALRYEGASRGAATGPARGGMALRNLFRQRTRTLLTFLGVGIGILAVVAVSALSAGMLAQFGTIMGTAELTAVQSGLSDLSLSSIDERVGKQIESMPEVAFASGATLAFAAMPENPLFMVSAYASQSPALAKFNLRRGALPQGSGQIALGWRAADDMRKNVGDTLRVLGSTFRVVGVYETGTNYQDSGGLATLRELQRLLGKPRKVMFYEIKLQQSQQIEAVLAKLQRSYPTLSISRSSKFLDTLPDMKNMQRIANAITALTLLVGTVVVMNTMVMSVFERTREIGVLRALGWVRRQVLALIICESILLTLTSGLLGLGAAWLLLHGMALLPGMASIARMITIVPSVVLRVIALCVALGTLGGVYSAWHATRLLPVEALRYE